MRNSNDKIPTTGGNFLARTGFIVQAPTFLWILLAVLIVEPKECPC